MLAGAFLWALLGASMPLSVVVPQNPVRIAPRQTALFRVSLQFQQPEWKYFHAKWKFLSKNAPILFYSVECKGGPADRTCEPSVEKEGRYRARVDIEEGGSLVLKDVEPEDAGKYGIHVSTLDESASAEVELVVMEGVLASPEPVSLPPRAVSAAVNHTAWLPLALQPLGPAWTFLSIKWELLGPNGNIPVLVCLISNCSSTALAWWLKTCAIHKEVVPEYLERVDVFRNGTLVIHSVAIKDAGIYQATLLATGVKIQATVNLTVIPGTSGSLPPEAVARIVLAGLLLCFLALLVGEHVWAMSPPGLPPAQGRG
ncbi:uncharacterized protein LOC143822463 [Paroedura picta]|uniref:uncharacterized protein LOC143822463 n=1 Tax=Paroedura picta TaxID=143630 RepID=UPI0040568FFB